MVKNLTCRLFLRFHLVLLDKTHWYLWFKIIFSCSILKFLFLCLKIFEILTIYAFLLFSRFAISAHFTIRKTEYLKNRLSNYPKILRGDLYVIFVWNELGYKPYIYFIKFYEFFLRAGWTFFLEFWKKITKQLILKQILYVWLRS